MVELNDLLIRFLEEDPELYKIIKSQQHMSVLREIAKENINFANLIRKIYFKKDTILNNILDTLIQRQLVQKINISNDVVYYLTEKGDSLMKLYDKNKKNYDLI